ncbi:hypothetical protein GCM10010216_21740 [Streptomyces flaveolus]|nr:hypothetical protein GCM10010216_21740 [Streptomyces flaveolus]
MRIKRLLRRLGEVIDAGAGGIELFEKGDGLTAHGLLDLRQLAHMRGAQCVSKPFGFRLDAALAASLFQK